VDTRKTLRELAAIRQELEADATEAARSAQARIDVPTCRLERGRNARVCSETAMVAHTVEITERVHDRACPMLGNRVRSCRYHGCRRGWPTHPRRRRPDPPQSGSGRVVRAVLAPRAGEPYREPPVVQQRAVQQPTATSGLAPGWYPDQNESNLVRYYDGRVWTSQPQPRN